jgi:hypothetical protein
MIEIPTCKEGYIWKICAYPDGFAVPVGAIYLSSVENSRGQFSCIQHFFLVQTENVKKVDGQNGSC